MAGAIARQLIAETRETAGRATQEQREGVLLALVLQDVAALIPLAAQARNCTIVFERQRSGVLYANLAATPAEVVDLTPNVLGAYDAWFNGLLTQQGREVVLQGIRDRLDGILKAQQGGDGERTGQYL